MNKLNCVIVDDDMFCRKIILDYVTQTEELNLIGEYESPVKAMNILNKQDVDLVFLDIEMPQISGMELIKNLKKKPSIILITSHEEFAIEAYENDVIDYIVKPVSFARFYKAVNKVIELNGTPGSMVTNGDFYVKSDGSLIKINPKEIHWIEALENYMIFHLGQNKYTVHITMKAIEEKLPSKDFIRVHRSFIVRKDKIEAITGEGITIKNNHIPVGRTYKKELINNINLL
ncbi:MAG: response regulator transcription factor [Flavobacteriales bacterium]|nr:response regulator transcription factor [Flavobacteriales bacterium]